MKPDPISVKGEGGATVRKALADAERRLTAVPGVPRLDAEILMAAALGVPIGEMMLSYLDAPAPARFEALVRRRLTQEPMGYVVGRVGFWTIELDVGPGALIPRADSESLIEAAVAQFQGGAPAKILDLGTGPGTLLLAALDQWPQARGLGVDASEAALGYARANAERLGMAPRAEWRLGDWAQAIDERFDLILVNPPYVEDATALIPGVVDWEPGFALFGGVDGLDHYRALAPQLARLLAHGGVACVEIGARQEKALIPLFETHGFTIESRKDLRGIVRCLILTLDWH
ncbi:MAG: peptide chain release factor N(5)-glutamine methyltransferase [Sphingosinicella sp.]|uniref:peptide chain release factor N(5)-glutamine methyltransferase n=1 Tax=Sphingosinicella sp. TaxID=1917971 RepID=UPI004037DA0C